MALGFLGCNLALCPQFLTDDYYCTKFEPKVVQLAQ